MKKRWLTLFLVLPALALAGLAWADDDDDDDDDDERSEHVERRERSERRATAAPRTPLPGEDAYRKECGSCHLAYPPGMLPAASWAKLMTQLDKHFDQNAEVDQQTQQELTMFLVKNAAEAGSHPLSGRVLRSLNGRTPLRLMDVPFMRHEHDELRPEVYARPAIQTRANCAACHPAAERWVFDEHGVKIPR